MHATKPLTVNDHVVTYLAADDPPPIDWLEDMGGAVDENSACRLTR